MNIDIGSEMVVLCREVNTRTGEIMVYQVSEPVADDLLVKLAIRARLNPELRYFVTARVRWEGVWHKDYYRLLKKKKLTDEAISLMGGIVEVK